LGTLEPVYAGLGDEQDPNVEVLTDVR